MPYRLSTQFQYHKIDELHSVTTEAGTGTLQDILVLLKVSGVTPSDVVVTILTE